MVIPTIPQLHEGVLGPHVVSTDLDSGSFNANLVCGPHDKPGTLASAHPFIKFDIPIQSLRLLAKSTLTGKVIWDGSYGLGGSQELPRDAVAAGGAHPTWEKICTPNGAIENYRIDISAEGGPSGHFDSSVTFSSNNAHTVQTSKLMFAKKPKLPKIPELPPTVPILPDDMNPIKYF